MSNTESNTTGQEISHELIIEAILFASDTALPASRIAQILDAGTIADVKKAITALNDKYEKENRSFRIEHIANGYRMMSLPVFHPWLEKLKSTRNDSRLSQAALETLAVIAYKQPVIRAEIEAIRGVAVGEVVNRLREINLVKIVGRAEDLGRPLLYGTTRKFLEVFGLGSLKDLPQIESLIPPEKQKPKAEKKKKKDSTESDNPETNEQPKDTDTKEQEIPHPEDSQPDTPAPEEDVQPETSPEESTEKTETESQNA